MEIVRWKKAKALAPGQLVRVNEAEALEIIASLSHQILDGDPNTHRHESLTTKGEYFSIAVHKKPTR